MSEASSLDARLRRVRERIARACARAGRAEDSVRLLAVSKRHSPDSMREAYAAGQREFGENYVQELQQKAGALSDLPDLRFRFIGRLQRNKAKYLVPLGCAIDSVDSLELARALSHRAQVSGATVEVLLQVNVDAEPQKGGVALAHAGDMARAVGAMASIRLTGLMTIPRASGDPEDARAAFARLRRLGEELRLPELSMGMSADLEIAIEEGATIVRVGTAIFGPRLG